MVDYLVASGFIAERVSQIDGLRSAHSAAARSRCGARGRRLCTRRPGRARCRRKARRAKYNLEKKSSELRTCFIYKGGAYPAWLSAKDKSIFCGNFGKGRRANPMPEASRRRECTPKRKAITTAKSRQGQTNYDSHEQGVTVEWPIGISRHRAGAGRAAIESQRCRRSRSGCSKDHDSRRRSISGRSNSEARISA